MRRWWIAGLIVSTLFACDRGRAVQEVGAQGTRATHARDDVERVAKRSAWQADAGTDAAHHESLEPIAETPLAVGKLEVVAETKHARLERQAWSFAGIRGQAWRVRIPRAAAKLKVLPTDTLEPVRTLAGQPNGDFVVINGGFYDVDRAAMGLVVNESNEVVPLRKNGGSGIVESRDGTISIVHRSKWEPGAEEALQSIDRIIADGKSLMTEGGRERHAARSAVAVAPDHVWVVVAFEDQSISPGSSDSIQLRSTSFRGMPLWGFARYLRETTDATDALNLDGAVSTQLFARVGDEEVDIRGELGTINAVFVGAKP